jgi:hypothetical protein
MKKIIFKLKQILEIFAYATGIVSMGLVIVLSLSAFLAANLFGTAPELGDADSFVDLVGSTGTTTGDTVINGDLGASPSQAITGFPPGIVTAPDTIHAGNAVAASAQSDALKAYNPLAGQACNINLTGEDLAGQILIPGLDCIDTSAQLTGTLFIGFDPMAAD